MFQLLQMWDQDSAHLVRSKSTADAKVRHSENVGALLKTFNYYTAALNMEKYGEISMYSSLYYKKKWGNMTIISLDEHDRSS